MDRRVEGRLVSQFPAQGEGGEAVTDLGLDVSGREIFRKLGEGGTDAMDGAGEGERAVVPSISRDTPHLLSEMTKAFEFFVSSDYPGLATRINVLEFVRQCPDAGDGRGVILHRDVLQSLAYSLLDKVHELEQARKGASSLPGVGGAVDAAEKLGKLADVLGSKDAEIKELRAALGESALRVRRLEAKIFK